MNIIKVCINTLLLIVVHNIAFLEQEGRGGSGFGMWLVFMPFSSNIRETELGTHFPSIISKAPLIENEVGGRDTMVNEYTERPVSEPETSDLWLPLSFLCKLSLFFLGITET